MIFSTSWGEMSSLRRSDSFVVRGEAWLAIVCACSSVPLFFKQAVMPVAPKVWLPILVSMPASVAQVYSMKIAYRYLLKFFSFCVISI